MPVQSIAKKTMLGILIVSCAACSGISSDSSELTIVLAGELTVGSLVHARVVDASGEEYPASETLLQRLYFSDRNVLEIIGAPNLFCGVSEEWDCRRSEPGTLKVVGGGETVIFVPLPSVGTRESVLRLSVTVPESELVVGNHFFGSPIVDEVLLPRGEYSIEEDVIVGTGGVLAVEAGSRFHVADGARVIASGGTLRLAGTQEFPIEFLGSSWGGLVVDASRTNSSIVEHVVVRGVAGAGTFGIDISCPSAESCVEGHTPMRFSSVRILDCERGLSLTNLNAVRNVHWREIEVSGALTEAVRVDVGSMGAVPHFSGPDDYRIEVVSGDRGPNYQVWPNPNRRFFIGEPIVVDPMPSSSVRSSQRLGGVMTQVEAGARFEFGPDGALYLGSAPEQFDAAGSLPVNRFFVYGTSREPVVFTSAAPIPARGDWRGIFFARNAATDSTGSGSWYWSQLVGAVIEYAGRATAYGGETVSAGVSVYTPLPAAGLAKTWFLDATTVRNNLGFGLNAAVGDVDFDVVEDPILFGIPPCICGNESGNRSENCPCQIGLVHSGTVD